MQGDINIQNRKLALFQNIKKKISDYYMLFLPHLLMKHFWYTFSSILIAKSSRNGHMGHKIYRKKEKKKNQRKKCLFLRSTV